MLSRLDHLPYGNYQRSARSSPILALVVLASSCSHATASWSRFYEASQEVGETFIASSSNQASATPPKVLHIGTALTLNYTSKHGFMGRAVQQAYLMLVSYVNNERGGIFIDGERHWLRLMLMDDNSEGTKVTQITEHMVNDLGIKHFLAPYSSGLTKFAAAIVNKSGAVMIAPCAASTSIFEGRPQVFGTLAPSTSFLTAALDRLKLFANTVGYIYEDLAFSRGACQQIDSLAPARNMRVVFGPGRSGSLPDNAEMSIVNESISRVATEKPDVLFACVYRDVCHRILEALERKKFNPKALVFTVCVTQADFREIAEDRAGFVMGVAPWTREVKSTSDLTGMPTAEFVKRYETLYPGAQVPYQAASAFAAAAALVMAIERAGTANDTAKVAQELRNMDVPSIFGRMAFDSEGQGINPIKAVQVQGNSTPVVAPESPTTADLVYPKPTFDALLCLNNDPYNVGRYGIAQNGSCLACNDTEIAPFNTTTGYRTCTKLICPPGTFSVIFDAQNLTQAGAYCASCYRGSYAPSYGYTQCIACPIGMFQSEKGQTHCADCTPGTFTGGTGSLSCTACSEGRYSSKPKSANCENRPEGAIIQKDHFGLYSNFTNADGWYLFEGQLLRCNHGEEGSACLKDGACHVDPETGETAMEGLFCGVCRKGYGRRKPDSVCEKCPSLQTSVFVIFGNGVLLSTVSFFVFLLVVFTDLSKPKNIQAIIMKQVLNYMGMTTVVLETINLKLPEVFSGTWISDVFKGIRMCFGTASPLYVTLAGECLAQEVWPGGGIYKPFITLALVWVPLWILGNVALFWIVWLLQRNMGKTPMKRSRLITLLLVNLFVIHPRTTELCLTAFRCKYFDKPRLMLDVQVDCGSSDHALWQFLGFLGFVLYSLGIPAVSGLILYRYKETDQLHNKKTLSTLGFLYSGFEPEYYYFESLLMLRKVLYQLIVLIPPFAASNDEEDDTIKCTSMLILAVIFLAWHMSYEPYDNRAYFTLDRIEAASLWAILVTLLVQAWLLVSDDAYIFQAEDNGDAGGSRSAKDIRDTICITIIILFHVRFMLLVVWLALRPALVSILQWEIFDRGTVRVEEDGLVLENADPRGRKLFTNMFSEIADLLIQARRKITFEELVQSLQYMCVNCAYHRQRDRYRYGWEDEDHCTMSITASIRNRDARKAMISRFLDVTEHHIIKGFKKYEGKAQAVANRVLGHEVPELRRSQSSEERAAEIADQLDKMKQFNSETVANSIGDRYPIDELHLSMVRLNKELGRRKVALEEKHKKEKDDSPGKAARQSIFGVDSTGWDDESGDLGFLRTTVRRQPPSLDTDALVQTELRSTKFELAQLRKTHEEMVEKHKLIFKEQEVQRKNLVSQIRHQMKLSGNNMQNHLALDALYEDQDEEDQQFPAKKGSSIIEDPTVLQEIEDRKQFVVIESSADEEGGSEKKENPQTSEIKDTGTSFVQALHKMQQKTQDAHASALTVGNEASCSSCGSDLSVKKRYCDICGSRRSKSLHLNMSEYVEEDMKRYEELRTKNQELQDKLFNLTVELENTKALVQSQDKELKFAKDNLTAAARTIQRQAAINPNYDLPTWLKSETSAALAKDSNLARSWRDLETLQEANGNGPGSQKEPFRRDLEPVQEDNGNGPDVQKDADFSRKYSKDSGASAEAASLASQPEADATCTDILEILDAKDSSLRGAGSVPSDGAV